jgi:hypothetical protein
MITKDANGNYFYDGNRILVSYMRGDHHPIKNPIQSRFEPEYLIKYYPGPVGVVIAFVHDGELKFGYSKANIWRGDRFDRKRGIEVSVDRAMLKNIQFPFEEFSENFDIYDALHRLYGRAKNYFKM